MRLPRTALVLLVLFTACNGPGVPPWVGTFTGGDSASVPRGWLGASLQIDWDGRYALTFDRLDLVESCSGRVPLRIRLGFGDRIPLPCRQYPGRLAWTGERWELEHAYYLHRPVPMSRVGMPVIRWTAVH